MDLDLELRLVGSAWLWLVCVSGGLEWPGIRRRLVLVELDDGSGGRAGWPGCWAFVVGGRAGEVEVSAVVVGVVVSVSGGGSGCDVEVALGFDLAADANSAGNGVLLAAMPQAYSISPTHTHRAIPLHYLSNLKPCPGRLSFFLLRGSDAPMGGWWYYLQQTPLLSLDAALPVSLPAAQQQLLPGALAGGPTPLQIFKSVSSLNRPHRQGLFALEISVPVQSRLGSLIGLGIGQPLAPTRPVGRGGVALVGDSGRRG